MVRRFVSIARRCGVAVAWWLGLLCLQGGPALGQDDASSVQEVVDGIIQPLLNDGRFPGAIVGVSLEGRRIFLPYGIRNEAGDPFAADTVVEIGSCTKVFTTALFAEAIGAGAMAPGDSIQGYMPDGINLQPKAQKVTLLELADFRSGLPRNPPDLPRRLQQRSIRHYTTADFFAYLQRWAPEEPPPAPYRYSNVSVGLLGYLVADALGRDWEKLLEARITRPLQMSDTVIKVVGKRRDRLAEGHRPDGARAPEWPVFAWYAAGVLRSTAQDMLSLGEAALGHSTVNGEPVPPELLAALQLATQPIYKPRNKPFKQAMAWVVFPATDSTHEIIAKDGGTVGFSSVIVLNPTKDLAVFVSANQSQVAIRSLGINIVRHIP